MPEIKSTIGLVAGADTMRLNMGVKKPFLALCNLIPTSF